jgi:hypothetical protein
VWEIGSTSHLADVTPHGHQIGCASATQPAIGSVAVRKLSVLRRVASIAVSLVAAGGLAAPCDAEPPPVARENALAGTRDWFVPRPQPRRIAAFCGSPSYAPGQRVDLHVDSRGHRFAFAVYRLGWYGGAGGRVVMVAAPRDNARQPSPRVLDDRPHGAKLLVTDWRTSASFTIGSDWTSGFYLVRVQDIDNGAESYASFVVRARTPARIVVVLATSTWQAYNTWGGLSLYRDLRRPPTFADPATLAHIVTFHRPYVQGFGAGDFFRFDQPLVSWLEQRDDDVSYATDLDVVKRRSIGPRTRLVLVSGHSEYHDGGEIAHYRSLAQRGVSLALLGGNNFVWHARFSHGGARETVWRRAVLDPLRATHQPTIRWADLGQPARELSGVTIVRGTPGNLRVRSPTAWPWRHTGVDGTTTLGRPLGAEWDGLPRGIAPGPGVRLLATAPLLGQRGARVAWALRTVAGGAFVVSFSELGFNWRLAPPLGVNAAWVNASTPPAAKRDYPGRSVESPVVQRVLANVIARALRPALSAAGTR